MRPTTKKAYEFFHEGTDALACVERNGIRIDTKYLDRTIKEVGADIDRQKEELKKSDVYAVWRRRFSNPNLDSNKQLGTILFKEMGFKSKFKTDTGEDKTDERALETVDHPFVKDYLQCKKLQKVLGTYLTGIRRETVDGILHPSYNLAGGMRDDQKGGAMSFRGSSSNPNFQNMPIRNKLMGKLIRSCFIPREGFWLGEVDFSTIEVRIAACVTGDRKLIQYVKDKTKDMHRDAACELFLLKPDQIVKKGTRDAAKNKFVFPQFYGSYYLDCARNIWEMMERNEYVIEGTDKLVKDHLRENGITRLGRCQEDKPPKKGTFEYQVKMVEDKFWNDWFKEYTAWKKAWWNKYLASGVVHLPTGFTATGVYRRNQVLNLPIQGPAFHCLLWSIIEINKDFRRHRMKSMIVGQIHDCVLPDIHETEIQDALNIMEEVMTEKLPKAWPWLIVPLEIEVDMVAPGQSWNDKAPWKRNSAGLWAAA